MSLSWTCWRTTETGANFYQSSWKRYWTHCIGCTNVESSKRVSRSGGGALQAPPCIKKGYTSAMHWSMVWVCVSPTQCIKKTGQYIKIGGPTQCIKIGGQCIQIGGHCIEVAIVFGPSVALVRFWWGARVKMGFIFGTVGLYRKKKFNWFPLAGQPAGKIITLYMTPADILWDQRSNVTAADNVVTWCYIKRMYQSFKKLVKEYKTRDECVFYLAEHFFWSNSTTILSLLFIRGNNLLFCAKTSICWHYINNTFQYFAILEHRSMVTVFKRFSIQGFATNFEFVWLRVITAVNFALQANPFPAAKFFF